MATTDVEQRFAATMKSLARRADLKEYVERTPAVYALLQRAAAKYVAGDRRAEALEAGIRLGEKDYAVSIEYIGENTADAAACEDAVREMGEIVRDLAERGMSGRVSFDLSHIGLMVDAELAYKGLVALAEQAEQAGIELFISMEEAAKTEEILAVYRRAAARYSNIGITLQAQLHRTVQDLNRLRSDATGRVRLVKGAYQEPSGLSIPRSEELNERYLGLVEDAIEQGHRISIATHDEGIVDEVIRRGWARLPGVEFEMLYGIRPDLCSRLKQAAYPVRVYLTYGREWYLYLCHRIAEYPPNIYQAIVDIASEAQADSAAAYE
ncbi:proline dehydrogenase family protein [Paenibacillus soyae]|uniref:proline dehydrogenase n=1 Tax=Paenibacillus soyae TaxID=2969249 RepID=A0A9X2S826_9BACL|nr:proline dehydrogenase family protein [Paenibacillus soyae]MCR2803914.1 proline dehydrogenase family protein [Paenibacillus soyae]